MIVERPRILRGDWTNEKTAGRLSPGQCADATSAPEDYDSGASRASSARHGKWPNENLAPLRRYLMSQVGRPWDKVYGEIRRTIDTRSAIGLHVLQHLEGFVSIHTFVRDGQICEFDWRGAQPVRGLYVHPATGILRCTKNWRKRRDRKKKPEQELEFVWVNETAAYKKVNGLVPVRIQEILRRRHTRADAGKQAPVRPENDSQNRGP